MQLLETLQSRNKTATSLIASTNRTRMLVGAEKQNAERVATTQPTSLRKDSATTFQLLTQSLVHVGRNEQSEKVVSTDQRNKKSAQIVGLKPPMRPTYGSDWEPPSIPYQNSGFFHASLPTFTFILCNFLCVENLCSRFKNCHAGIVEYADRKLKSGVSCP